MEGFGRLARGWFDARCSPDVPLAPLRWYLIQDALCDGDTYVAWHQAWHHAWASSLGTKPGHQAWHHAWASSQGATPGRHARAPSLASHLAPRLASRLASRLAACIPGRGCSATAPKVLGRNALVRKRHLLAVECPMRRTRGIRRN
jgi:hypothetical protein